MKIRPVGTEFRLNGQTDRQAGRQAERHDETNSPFSHFANGSEERE